MWYAGASASAVAGCDYFSAFDCDAALASVWSKWFGVPVAAAGVLFYAAVFAASWLAIARSSAVADAGWRTLEAAVPLAAGSAAWFLGVQLVALDSFCVYCLTAHACGLAIAGLVVAARFAQPTAEAPITAIGLPTDRPEPAAASGGPPPLGLPTAAGALGVALLMGGQLIDADTPPDAQVVDAENLPELLGFGAGSLASEPETQPGGVVQAFATEALDAGRSDRATRQATALRPRRRSGGSRQVKFLQGRLKIDTYQQAVIGSPDAPHVVVELMDYACPHCREFHELLTEAIRRYEGRVAVVVMPVPGEVLCNPYVKKARPKSRGACRIAKVSLATAVVAPEDFAEVHEWLLEGDRMPQYTAALIEAQKHADADRLSKAVRDESGELDARIQQHVGLLGALYASGQKIALPTQIFPGRIVTGPPKTLETLCQMWADEFGIALPEPVATP